MSFLLARDTCAAWIRGVRSVQGHFLQNRGDLHLSVLTTMGLELWLLHPRTPARYLQTYGALTQAVRVVSVDEPVAHRAAQLGSLLTPQRPRLAALDLLLAATALVTGFVLVTHAVQHYRQVPGLGVADWLGP